MQVILTKRTQIFLRDPRNLNFSALNSICVELVIRPPPHDPVETRAIPFMKTAATISSELSAQDILAIAINKTEEEIYGLENERRNMLERHRQELFQIEAKIVKKRRRLLEAQQGEML